MAAAVVYTVLLLSCVQYTSVMCSSEYTREDFPSDFVFGAGTSAFQYEGAWAEDGKSPSIWDTSTHAGKVGESMAEIASDGYHKYKEDIKLMSDTGLEAYRFSISWSRLLPHGRGPVNPKALEYYNQVIDELIKHDIQPHVTMHHLDLPQVLQDEYGGWLSPKFIEDFTELADVCFREFGDRVSYWTTMNEPNINSMSSFDYGYFPPHRCSYPFGDNCTGGNSTVEPYIAAHHMILAHSSAVELYRRKYQGIQKGQIGINIYSLWFSPLTNSTEDVITTKIALDFIIGWILNPLVFGDYPEIMKKNVGTRLPSFTKSESEQLKGSYDFIGLNYYYSLYVSYDSSIPMAGPRDLTSDMFARFTDFVDVPPIHTIVPPSHPKNDFPSLRKMLNHLKMTYRNPPIYIHENGFGFGVPDTMHDVQRISSISGYIRSVYEAIRDGADVRGYFVWAFVDVYEWISGYAERYGLFHVSFEENGLDRTPRLSAHWYRDFLTNGSVVKIANLGRTSPRAHSS